MADITAPALFTRAIRIDEHVYELQPGDQVDISPNLDRRWVTVCEYVADCSVAVDVDVLCGGSCHGVILFDPTANIAPWHVRSDDEIYARFQVVAA